jgi:hypothetical protein
LVSFLLSCCFSFVRSYFLWNVEPHAQPPTWRTRVSLLVRTISFDLSGIGGPTSCYATANITLRVLWPRKAHHWVKMICCILQILNVHSVIGSVGHVGAFRFKLDTL